MSRQNESRATRVMTQWRKSFFSSLNPCCISAFFSTAFLYRGTSTSSRERKIQMRYRLELLEDKSLLKPENLPQIAKCTKKLKISEDFMKILRVHRSFIV